MSPLIAQVAPVAREIESGGYGWLLLRTGLILSAVCLLAYVLIRFGLRRWVDGPTSTGRRLEILERRSLGSRGSLFAVRAGSRVFLVGSGESEVRLIAELPPEEWGDDEWRDDERSDDALAETAGDRSEGAP